MHARAYVHSGGLACRIVNVHAVLNLRFARRLEMQLEIAYS